jgi:glycosyltransferase involved in cell wall biosynthesis
VRVCLISKQFDPSGGGSERYAYAISTALAARGHDVDVFALGDTDSLPDTADHDQLSVTFVGERRRALVTFETLYYSILTRQRVDFDAYDVIHGTLMPASPVALAVRPPSTPLVVTSHGTSLGEVRSHKLEVATDYPKKLFFHPLNVAMDMVTAPRAERVIVISEDSRDELARRYPISRDALIHVPHGVDADRFHPDRTPHSTTTGDRLTLLHVGRLVSRKHVDLGLRALASLDRDDVELLVAGDGTHRDRLEELAERLGVADRTKFLGFVPEADLPGLYAGSDAFLFLSRYEGFGLTFLEAMASATPVIGTAVGGFPDIVTDGTDGFVVDRDPAEVASVVDRLADSPDLLADVRTVARATAESRTWATVAAETEQVYETVVDRPDAHSDR